MTYSQKQLDRDVVAVDQIRTVIKTFRDDLFTELFPGRTTVPKTLIFAKDDSHADDIVQVVREVFDKGNQFATKITYRTHDGTPDELLQAFRNSMYPRIVVTVDMIATGTDVSPLECLVFMRSVQSRTYFGQMLGRGVRVINDADFPGGHRRRQAQGAPDICGDQGVGQGNRAPATQVADGEALARCTLTRPEQSRGRHR